MWALVESPEGKFVVKCKKLVQEIEEVELEEDYEFLTEDDMRDVHGWSELL